MGIKNITKYDNKSQMGNKQEDFELWKKIETFQVMLGGLGWKLAIIIYKDLLFGDIKGNIDGMIN